MASYSQALAAAEDSTAACVSAQQPDQVPSPSTEQAPDLKEAGRAKGEEEGEGEVAGCTHTRALPQVASDEAGRQLHGTMADRGSPGGSSMCLEVVGKAEKAPGASSEAMSQQQQQEQQQQQVGQQEQTQGNAGQQGAGQPAPPCFLSTHKEQQQGDGRRDVQQPVSPPPTQQQQEARSAQASGRHRQRQKHHSMSNSGGSVTDGAVTGAGCDSPPPLSPADSSSPEPAGSQDEPATGVGGDAVTALASSQVEAVMVKAAGGKVAGGTCVRGDADTRAAVAQQARQAMAALLTDLGTKAKNAGGSGVVGVCRFGVN